jgi:hypothetical protein
MIVQDFFYIFYQRAMRPNKLKRVNIHRRNYTQVKDIKLNLQSLNI